MGESTPNPPEWLSLEPDERVCIRTAPSVNLVFASLLVGFPLLVVMSIVVSLFTDLATGRVVIFAMLVLVLAALGGVYLGVTSRGYVLTSTRACVGVGLLSTRVASVALDDVCDVTVEQSDWQDRLNVGSVRFVTDEEAASVAFWLVEDPESVQQHVRQVVDLSSGAGTRRSRRD